MGFVEWGEGGKKYQVRARHVASFGGQEERIMEWISGGKDVKSGKDAMFRRW